MHHSDNDHDLGDSAEYCDPLQSWLQWDEICYIMPLRQCVQEKSSSNTSPTTEIHIYEAIKGTFFSLSRLAENISRRPCPECDKAGKCTEQYNIRFHPTPGWCWKEAQEELAWCELQYIPVPLEQEGRGNWCKVCCRHVMLLAATTRATSPSRISPWISSCLFVAALPRYKLNTSMLHTPRHQAIRYDNCLNFWS